MAKSKQWLHDFAADLRSLRAECKLLMFWWQRNDIPKLVFLRTEIAIDFILMWRVFSATQEKFTQAGLRERVWREFDHLQLELLNIDEILEQNARMIHDLLASGELDEVRALFVESMGPEQAMPWWLGGD